MAKLSRKQIREGLEQVPIDTVLLGVNSPIGKLTPKQREFARLVAMGETKAGAYREAYKSKGNPHTVGNKGYVLSKLDEIQATVEAYQAAIEAAKYRTPSQLRELVIHQLTQHALDNDCPPAQRIKALELLGKVSEVAAFTERKETTVINQSADIKQRLLESLRNVVDIEPNDNDASSLLDELANGGGKLVASDGDPHHPGTTLSIAEVGSDSIHINPHEQSPAFSDPHEQSRPDSSPLDDFAPEEKNPLEEDPTPLNIEDPPLPSENEKGGGYIFSENDENLR